MVFRNRIFLILLFFLSINQFCVSWKKYLLCSGGGGLVFVSVAYLLSLKYEKYKFLSEAKLQNSVYDKLNIFQFKKMYNLIDDYFDKNVKSKAEEHIDGIPLDGGNLGQLKTMSVVTYLTSKNDSIDEQFSGEVFDVAKTATDEKLAEWKNKYIISIFVKNKNKNLNVILDSINDNGAFNALINQN
jgi:hypothetical protein